jgi:acrylyl-CoA reductase (NADPH)
MFRAILLSKQGDQFNCEVSELADDALPSFETGGVLVGVEYSTLNFKDGLAITNRSPVVRKWPMVAGIDGAGTVLASAHPNFVIGQRVVQNGWGVGESQWGCLAQKASLSGDWLVPLPDGLTTRQAMAIGTAGYTAMLSVMALERQGIKTDSGDILVTGATGGVGSIAVALLARLGYKVVASTGKLSEAPYLRHLGASDVIDRSSLAAPGKPLQKERWGGVVDAVGSHTLANACAQTRYGGVVTACGLAQGMDFPASVAPFILRSVQLIGIDSVMAPYELRVQAWARLVRDIDLGLLESLTTEVGLAAAIDAAGSLMAGGARGRYVVDVNA